MITKFKLFESDHSDIDPFDEENWNEEDIIVEGDIVMCVNVDNMPKMQDKIILNRIYRVIHISKDVYDTFLDLIDIETGEKYSYWKKYRFKKI